MCVFFVSFVFFLRGQGGVEHYFYTYFSFIIICTHIWSGGEGNKGEQNWTTDTDKNIGISRQEQPGREKVGSCGALVKRLGRFYATCLLLQISYSYPKSLDFMVHVPNSPTMNLSDMTARAAYPNYRNTLDVSFLAIPPKYCIFIVFSLFFFFFPLLIAL